MPVPPGDTARSGHCSSGVCALCPRAVGQGATLVGARCRVRTCTGLLPTDFESVSSTSSGNRACGRGVLVSVRFCRAGDVRFQDVVIDRSFT